jgi:oligogalacturonide lyase
MKAEWETTPDRISGIEVTRLTNYKGHSHHLYFTNPGWYDGGKRLLFASERNNRNNLFGIELASGEIEQLTDLCKSGSIGGLL